MKISLGTRIFVMTALVVVAAVGAAVALTFVLGEQIARGEADKALARAGTVQSSLQFQRFDQLALIADLFVADPYLVAYIVEATAGDDGTLLSSIDDVLRERQDQFGYDFGIVLDVDGRVLARTDDPDAVGEDLSERPLVQTALDDFEGFGVWEEDGALFNAVVVPVVTAEERLLEGFFVAGFAIDDLTALEIRRVSDAEMAFLADPAAPRLVAGTLEPGQAEALVGSIRSAWSTWESALARPDSIEQLEVELLGRRWLAVIRPLVDSRDQAVGAAVSLASLDDELAPFRRIGITLLLVGLGAVIVALFLSFWLSWRVMRPVRALAAAAERASKGRYDQPIDLGRTDEIGQLATSFDQLLSELREKQDMETYLVRLSRTLPDDDGEPALEPAAERQLALLAIDLRGFPSGGDADPGETASRLGRDRRRMEASVERRRGQVEGAVGHRFLASFEGDDGSYRALGAAAEVLASPANGDPPVLALTPGRVTTGTVAGSEGSERFLVGPGAQQLDTLLREGTPGDLILSPAAHDALADVFTGAGLALSRQRGLLSNRPIYVLDATMAARVTGIAAPPPPPSEGETPLQIAQPTLSEVAPGTLLGDRFEILSVLGAGGMGVVYKVRDRELDDLVALKMLKRELWGDAALLERLKSELKLARRITHPNVMRTFDFGEVDGMPFITMEYVQGLTLRDLLHEGPLPFSAGLRLARQLCRGLSVAHEAGVLHRDIKPENLLVQPNGNAKLMDFGIARPIVRMDEGQTQPGMLVGTPQYLAPEQLRGEAVDARADLFACGVVLYELFTGRLPFVGGNPMQVIMATLNEEPASPREYWAEIPVLLEETILRCLAKKAGQRYASAEALLDELEQVRA